MNREEIVQEVNAVLMKGFEVPIDKIRPEAHLYHDLGIDSLDAIDMLVYIEEKAGRPVDGTLFKSVRTVGDIYQVMAQVMAEDTAPKLPTPPSTAVETPVHSPVGNPSSDGILVPLAGARPTEPAQST